ncbi:N-methyl-D-aspartate receptor NMDAR2C subunit [Patescibacteria group bacterium]
MSTKRKDLWALLWKNIGAKGNMEKAYNTLVSKYSEPHRSYHTLNHIDACIEEFNQVRYFVQNPNEVEWALWYHDVIYDPKAKDNEKRSADLSMKEMLKDSLSEDTKQLVVNLIMVTKHTEFPIDFDMRIVADVDLAILGQSKRKFDEYEQQIRKEYQFVSEDDFVEGRLAVLEYFLRRPVIYLTQFFQNKYEKQARKNIINSIQCLTKRKRR